MGVGQPIRRFEDARILAGRSTFLDDVPAHDALHVAFVRSPHAHARVHGVRNALLTAADLHGAAPMRIDPPPGLTVAPAPHPLLASTEVRYEGQAVAAVVGATRAEAEDAADAVEVDYEPLPAVDDPRASTETLARWEKRAGDVDGAFASAAHVVRTDHVLPRVVAWPLEPRGVLAIPGDRLTVYASSQSAHRARAQLAQMLGRDDIRVRVPDVGGAFGTKGTLPPEAALTALVAQRLGRPAKWIEDRRENDLTAPQGRGQRGAVELAFDAHGRILALRARILADLGAYLLPSTAIPPHTTAMLLSGCYDIPAVEVFVTGVRTNKPPTGPYRGSGRPEATYLIETTIDAAARELRLDPVELRRRNLIRTFPHRTALGWTYDSGDYERCLDAALSRLPRRRERDSWAAPPPGDTLTGTGIALCVERSGGLFETAKVTRDGDDYVVTAGSTPSGQGHHTLFAQIAAERLGVAPERIRVVTGDTDALEDGVGTFASRSAVMGGNAVAAAADALGEARFASEQVFASGAYGATVEISKTTGEVRVTKLVAVDDAGRIINPLLAEGQVVGGAVQGLGDVLGMLDAVEAPPIETRFISSPSPLNPLGAKGIGEAGTIGAPAAVANAIADALGRHLDPPYTAERIWDALG